MKKLIALIALTAASAFAMANPLDNVDRIGGPTVGITYDSARVNHGTPLRDVREASLTIAQDTTIGTFDAALISRNVDASILGRDATTGFEVGYSTHKSYVASNLGFKGRLAYGQVNGVDKPAIGRLTGLSGNGDYLSLNIEAQQTLAEHVTAIAGYRHRHGLESTVPHQNRWYAGAELDLTKKLGLRVAYAHDRQFNRIANGVATSLTYKY